MYDVLIQGRPLGEVTVPVRELPGLICAPATIDLAGAEIELVSQFSRESRLAASLTSVRAAFLDKSFDISVSIVNTNNRELLLECLESVQRSVTGDVNVEVIVLEIDPSGRRIRLSAKAVMEAREAEEVREWTERNAPPAEGLGTLAEKLRSALKSQEK